MNEYLFVPGESEPISARFRIDKSVSLGAPSFQQLWLIPVSEATEIFGPRLSELIPDEVLCNTKIVTHPQITRSASEKAELLGWPNERVIKALYYQNTQTNVIYAFVVPNRGYLDFSTLSREQLGFNPKKRLRVLPESSLPAGMRDGTCSPFMLTTDVGATILVFDSGFVAETMKTPRILHDFALPLGASVSDMQLSLQMNYACVYEMLAERFPSHVMSMVMQYN